MIRTRHAAVAGLLAAAALPSCMWATVVYRPASQPAQEAASPPSPTVTISVAERAPEEPPADLAQGESRWWDNSNSTVFLPHSWNVQKRAESSAEPAGGRPPKEEKVSAKRGSGKPPEKGPQPGRQRQLAEKRPRGGEPGEDGGPRTARGRRPHREGGGNRTERGGRGGR